MVDFQLMGILNTQEEMVVALFRAQTHRRVLIVVKDNLDVRRISMDIFGKLKDLSWVSLNRQSLVINRGSDNQGGIQFVREDQLERAARGQEFDLVWFRFLSDPGASSTEWSRHPYNVNVNLIVGACRLGYNPLVLWGNVPYQWRKI